MISVITCTYNQEKYLAQTIESILMQKCSEPFEILIGDDCSTDSTGKIADEYQKRFPDKVHVVRPEKNMGAAQNFLRLVNASRGDFLSCLDGDDYWLQDDVLQKQYDIFNSNPKVGMVCAKAKCYIQSKGEYEGTLGYAGAENLMTMLRDNRDVAAPTNAFRKDLMLKCIEECQWYIDNNYFYDSIQAYWFAYNSKIKFIDEEIAAYRVLAASASHTMDDKKAVEYDRRYFAVKWHFILTHPDICNQEVFDMLMRDYDARTNYIAGISSQKVRTSKAYRLGNRIINPFRKLKNKG